MTVTAPSTTDWRQWWEVEARANGSDWPGILATHATVFYQLCQSRGLSS